MLLMSCLIPMARASPSRKMVWPRVAFTTELSIGILWKSRAMRNSVRQCSV
jgi:hypothetical protein